MAKKKALSRDQLTSPPDLEEVEVEKLGGGGVVYVRPLPLSLGFAIWDRQEAAEGEDENAERDMIADFVIYGVVNEDGERILDDDDRDAVMDWPMGDAQRIANAVQRVSGMGGGAAEEDVEGN